MKNLYTVWAYSDGGQGVKTPENAKKNQRRARVGLLRDSPVPRDRSTDRYFAQEVPLRRIKI